MENYRLTAIKDSLKTCSKQQLLEIIFEEMLKIKCDIKPDKYWKYDIDNAILSPMQRIIDEDNAGNYNFLSSIRSKMWHHDCTHITLTDFKKEMTSLVT